MHVTDENRSDVLKIKANYAELIKKWNFLHRVESKRSNKLESVYISM